MNKHCGLQPWLRLVLLLLLLPLAGGCAMVKLRTVETQDFTVAKRADVLSSGQLGAATREALQVIGIDPALCGQQASDCITPMSQRPGMDTEVSLAALAEL